MDPKEVYNLLNFIQTWVYWTFFVIFPIGGLLMCIIGGRWLMGSFLNRFDKQYNLIGILPIDINVFERGEKYKWEVAYGKTKILSALARCYLKPYWSSKNRRSNELHIKKYKSNMDPYFLACYALLKNKKQPAYRDDLAKFVLYDICLRGAKVVTILVIAAFIIYKYIIPSLLNY